MCLFEGKDEILVASKDNNLVFGLLEGEDSVNCADEAAELLLDFVEIVIENRVDHLA